MSANPSSTPISPQGMGGRSAFLLIMLLLGLGAFYWLTHDPNALDAYSDLKRMFETPDPAAAAQPVPPVDPSAAGSAVKTEEDQLRQAAEAQMAKLEKDLAEARRQLGSDAPDRSPLALVADPSCAPIGRQWRVSGHVANASDKAAASRKLKIALRIDGEVAEEQVVTVGPFGPREMLKYEALFRPNRGTRNHSVTASASWER